VHGNDEPHLTSILIQSNDVADTTIHRTANCKWVTSIDSAGRPHGTHCIIQEIEHNDIKVRIQYAEFSNDAEASKATDFHINNVASIFKKGLWEGAKRQRLGDETWFSHNAETCALLFRAGEICVLVSCYGKDRGELERVAELFAERIAYKASKDAREPLLKSP
jgi:hypothetical protein